MIIVSLKLILNCYGDRGYYWIASIIHVCLTLPAQQLIVVHNSLVE